MVTYEIHLFEEDNGFVMGDEPVELVHSDIKDFMHAVNLLQRYDDQRYAIAKNVHGKLNFDF